MSALLIGFFTFVAVVSGVLFTLAVVFGDNDAADKKIVGTCGCALIFSFAALCGLIAWRAFA